ncbi:MAG: hypothetical protein ACOYOV_02840 [Bacteroidales bacterium]
MAETKVKGEDIKDGSVKAADLDLSAATEKGTAVDNDGLIITDSADNLTKRVKFSSLFQYVWNLIKVKIYFQDQATVGDSVPSGYKIFFAKADGFYFKNGSNVFKKFATIDDLGSTNADTLDYLHATAFARYDTAFTSSNKIVYNNAIVPIYVLNAYEHQNLNTAISDLYTLDANNKVIILQPGTYRITSCIDLQSYAVLGIIGCSREDTFIQSDRNSFLSNCVFLENLFFEIKGDEGSSAGYGDVISGIKNNKNTWLKNITIRNSFDDNLIYVTAIRYFSAGNNIHTIGFSKAIHDCTNFSDVFLEVNSQDTSLANYLVYNSLRISNIDILFVAAGYVFVKCSEVNNFNIESGIYTKTTAFDDCKNISNGRIDGLKYGITASHFINNVYIKNCFFAFYYSDKISLCFADTNDAGFYTCKGMVNNQSLNNTSSQYDACYADMSSVYAVNDSPDGGWNF